MAFIGESGNRGIHNAILVSLAEPQKDSRRIAAQKKSLIRNKRKRLPTSSYFDDNICDGDRFYPAGSGKRRRSRIQKANRMGNCRRDVVWNGVYAVHSATDVRNFRKI